MTKTTLYIDANYSAIRGPNPAIKDDQAAWDKATEEERWLQQSPAYSFVKAIGARDVWMIYDGTLNRSGVWLNDDGTPKAEIDWTQDTNQNDPPQRVAVERLARFIGSDQYAKFHASGDRFPPVLFDLENPSIGNRQLTIDVMRWIKAVTPNVMVGAYFAPAADWSADDIARHVEMADYACPSLYNWNRPTMAPWTWFDDVDRVTRVLDRYCPWMPRIAFVCPTYQLYWRDQAQYADILPLADKPLPAATWTKQIGHLVDRNYRIAFWYPGPVVTGIRPLISALKKWVF